MRFLPQPDPRQELEQRPSSTLHVRPEIAAVSFYSRFDFLFCLVFFYLLSTFHLLPAESIIWGLSQQGWTASEMLRVEISNMSKPGAKSCRAALDGPTQLGFQSQ